MMKPLRVKDLRPGDYVLVNEEFELVLSTEPERQGAVHLIRLANSGHLVDTLLFAELRVAIILPSGKVHR